MDETRLHESLSARRDAGAQSNCLREETRLKFSSISSIVCEMAETLTATCGIALRALHVNVLFRFWRHPRLLEMFKVPAAGRATVFFCSENVAGVKMFQLTDTVRNLQATMGRAMHRSCALFRWAQCRFPLCAQQAREAC